MAVQRITLPMPRNRAFTLIEIVLAVFILMLLLMLAVPSVDGVLADRRLRRSLDSFNDLVRQAEERTVKEQRAYQIVWEKGTDAEVRSKLLTFERAKASPLLVIG
jgi:Tfp pilus assembly protein FimT